MIRKSARLRRRLVSWVPLVCAVGALPYVAAQGAAAPPLAAERAPPDLQLGSGPFKSIMEEVTALPMHTVYRPADLTSLGERKLPIVAWGNGACVANGSSHRWFLSEIASYGFLVIANGAIGNDPPLPAAPALPPKPLTMPAVGQLPPPPTHSAQLIEAIDWAQAENARIDSPLRGHIAVSKVAVMGMSCGGVQAIEAAGDPRVTTVMVWNSGLFPQPTAMAGGKTLDKTDLEKLHTPVAYISGDATDIAFANANDDFSRLHAIPAFRAYERGVAHGGTYWEPGGGEFGGVAVAWLAWQLQGNRRASHLFVGRDCGLCANPRWVVQKKNLE